MMLHFTLYMTTDCNFKCQYCYEDYHKHFQLNQETLVNTINFIMNYAENEKVFLDFLGGEPLLKKELIYQAVEYIRSHYPSRVEKYFITTNCSLMDEEFINFMQKNDFSVRLSFDGNKITHDLNRVAKDGKSYYEKIFENIMKVKRCNIQASVRMTVAANTIPHMFENIVYLHTNGLSDICMIMDVYLKLNDDLQLEFEKQVDLITNYYLAEAKAGRPFTIDEFDGKMLNMLCNFGNCFGMCDAGIGNFKIFPNGQIYPCGFLTNDDKYCIGNIKEGIDTRKSKIIALSNFDKNDSKCKDCRIRDFCHGMKCGYMNFVNTGKINVPSDAECIFEHTFYNAMVQILEYYLKQPKEILEEKIGVYMNYIFEQGLKLSKYGEQISQRLKDEQ